MLTAKELQDNIDAWFLAYRVEKRPEERQGTGCIACGGRDLVPGDVIVADVIVPDVFVKGGVPTGRKSRPMVQVICRNCEYIHLLPGSLIFGPQSGG